MKKQRKSKWYILVIMICMILIRIGSLSNRVEAKTYKTYKIKTTTKPCDNSIRYSTYNKYTKHYYTILSYLKKLEQEGGGTLILQKGTYTITNTLYVPSNVTIRLKDGVILKKGTKTGTSKMPPSKSIVQLVSYSNSKKKGVHKKYNGVSNVSIIGEGTAILDMKYDFGSIGIMMGHNQNVRIKNITFQNMYSGHFIEMDASNDVIVEACVFKNHKKSPKNNKEAINLDTPDRTTKGFHAVWTSYDKTPNKDVIIKNCTFKDLERAIGTHKYSEGKYHTNIQVIDNYIKQMNLDAIRIMNWDKPVITGNTITNVAKKAHGLRAILASGVYNPRITGNTFDQVSRPIQIMSWKNTGPGEQYPVIYSEITQEQKNAMANNILTNGDEYFIRYNKEYKEYVKMTEKIYLSGSVMRTIGTK